MCIYDTHIYPYIFYVYIYILVYFSSVLFICVSSVPCWLNCYRSRVCFIDGRLSFFLLHFFKVFILLKLKNSELYLLPYA